MCIFYNIFTIHCKMKESPERLAKAMTGFSGIE